MVNIPCKTVYTIYVTWYLGSENVKINPYEFGPIGSRIKQARKAKRYTQEELAESINMGSKNISQLERGMTGLSVSTLIGICKTLDVSADYILFGIKGREQGNSINTMLSELSEKEQLYAENLLSVYVEACKNIFQLK